jgi:PTH2 family peptidyl-tRNA hydrolase
MATKQVIVMRTDLNMRKGKMVAQGSHASMAFLTRHADVDMEGYVLPKSNDATFTKSLNFDFAKEVDEWMQNSFTKICVGVKSEEELDEIYNRAKEAGLTVHMVVDSGLTEFNGVPTKTCLAIGPHYSEKIDAITGQLKLL